MGLYQRRRPSPIQILPNPVRRQEETSSPESPDSPEESGGENSPASPSSTGAPSPTGSQSPATTEPPPPPATTAPAIAPTAAPAFPASSSSSSPTSSSPQPSTVAQTSSSAQPSSSIAQAPSSQPSTAAASSSTSSAARAPVPSITAGPPAPNVAVGDDPEEPPSPASPSSSGASELPVSSSPQPTSPVSSASPTSADSSPLPERTGPPRSQLSGASSGIEKDPNHTPSGHHLLGKGAEAALITSAILGFIALVIGGWFLYKRRRRRMESQGVLTTENGFAPGPGGTQSTRETVQIGFDPNSDAHMTRSTNNSNSLFGGSHYQRPETVSTSTNSRAAPDQPLPTPNPFADPPRNKAFDVLRGRPRSTTLTDRGSWIKNPFKDPASDRFDPFGELQEKARQERVRYMQEIRQEEMERLEREREQQFLEKERMGLGVPEQARKGSGVTIDGVGVLDRSGSGGFR